MAQPRRFRGVRNPGGAGVWGWGATVLHIPSEANFLYFTPQLAFKFNTPLPTNEHSQQQNNFRKKIA